MKKTVLGVTGGVGAGKSTVLKIFKEEYQAYVIEADEVGRRLEKRGQPGFEAVVREFGEEILGSDGEIDRAALAKLVFSDAEALQRLNALLHPMIYEEIQAEIQTNFQTETEKCSETESSVLPEEVSGIENSGENASNKKRGEPVKLYLLEAAILFETGFDRCCDATVYVRADIETRIERLRKTRGYSKEKAEGVIANQLKDEEFLARADFVIENGGDLEETKRQVHQLMAQV